MNDDARPIVVGVDGSVASEVAQRWALEEARTHGRPVRLVCVYIWGVNIGAANVYATDAEMGLTDLRCEAERVIEAALTEMTIMTDDVSVSGEAVQGGGVEQILLKEAESAAVLVLGSRQLHAAGSFLLGSVSANVAARSACPTVVTRGPGAKPRKDAVIAVGVDGSPESDAVLGFAFDEARRHGRSLHVVLCWNPSVLSGAYWMAGPAARNCEHLALWLSHTLAAWCAKYPEIMVTSAIPEDHPVRGLVKESAGQFLLVVGAHGRHATIGTLLGSVSQGVLHHAMCPVAVVPLSEENPAE